MMLRAAKGSGKVAEELIEDYGGDTLEWLKRET
jgi:hypothetical protein